MSFDTILLPADPVERESVDLVLGAEYASCSAVYQCQCTPIIYVCVVCVSTHIRMMCKKSTIGPCCSHDISL